MDRLLTVVPVLLLLVVPVPAVPDGKANTGNGQSKEAIGSNGDIGVNNQVQEISGGGSVAPGQPKKANATSAAADFVAPEEGWSDWELHCLNDMEDADTTYDHMLNHQEYIVFAGLVANRLFGGVHGLDAEKDWEIGELYEELLLRNPKGTVSGIDIFGSGFGTLGIIDDEQKEFLKTVCGDTKETILHISRSRRLL